MEKIKISLPIIVEGRYDKSALSGFIDGTVITTGGFSIFNNKEKQALLRRLAADGIIILTDSDGGGKQIRKFLQSILPPDKIHNLYIPRVEGKEKRKSKPSKAGTLGVEGMEKDVLLRLLAPFTVDENRQKSCKMITKVDFFTDKLTGCDNASENRATLCRAAGLPDDMTPNALLEAMNLLYGYDGYKKLIDKINRESDQPSHKNNLS
jgi:ribonuclease M5